jgi:hypothetical protein
MFSRIMSMLNLKRNFVLKNREDKLVAFLNVLSPKKYMYLTYP